MTNRIAIFNAYHEAAWANPPTSVAEAHEKYLSDDFQSLDVDGNVQMDRQTYISMSQLLFASFNDFNTVVSDMREAGNALILSSHFEGTHTGDLDLSAMGVGVIPASGKKIVWPEAKTRWTFDGDKITSVQALDDRGGMGAFLAALGVAPPA